MSFLAAYGYRRRGVPGGRWFTAYVSALAFMVLVKALHVLFPGDDRATYLFHNLSSSAAASLGPFMLLMAAELAGWHSWTRARSVGLLLLPTTLLAVASFTNAHHGLYWAGPLDHRLWTDHGPLGVAALLYAYSAMLSSAALLASLFFRWPSPYRWQAAILLAGVLLLWGAHVYIRRGAASPLALRLGPGAIASIPVSLLLALGIYRFRLLAITPVARDAAVAGLDEAVLVLDSKERLIDLNDVAQRLLGPSFGGPKGQPVSSLPAPLPSLFREAAAGREEVEASLGDPPRTYQARLVPLSRSGSSKFARLLVLADVTTQKEAQARGLERERAQATAAERERLGQELHDRQAQVLAQLALACDTARCQLTAGMPEQAGELLVRAAEAARNAQVDVRDYLLGVSAGEKLEQGCVAAISDFVRRFASWHERPVELQVEPGTEQAQVAPVVALHLLRMVQQALSNGCQHAGEDARLEVRLAVHDGSLRAMVLDDGVGFEPTRAAGNGHYGLSSIRKRAEEVRGAVELCSAPGQGTRITIDVPLVEQERGS